MTKKQKLKKKRHKVLALNYIGVLARVVGWLSFLGAACVCVCVRFCRTVLFLLLNFFSFFSDVFWLTLRFLYYILYVRKFI